MLCIKHSLEDRSKFDKATTAKTVLHTILMEQPCHVEFQHGMAVPGKLTTKKFDKATTAKLEWLCRISIDPRDCVLYTTLRTMIKS